MKKIVTMLLTLCLLTGMVCSIGCAEAEKSAATTLVAYFSATGNTKPLAEYAAAHLLADLYEIAPAIPYTDADLNYGDNGSRTSVEQNDDLARPEIAEPLESIEQYDVIYLGYPIWWGQAPKIISTFLEGHDFSGKIIIPFCTSASSGVGSSAENLHALCDDTVIWLDGTRFSSGTDEAAIAEWLDGLEIPQTTDDGSAHE